MRCLILFFVLVGSVNAMSVVNGFSLKPTPTVSPSPSPSASPSPTESPSPTPEPAIYLVQQKTATAIGDVTVTMDAPFTQGTTLIVCATYVAGDDVTVATSPSEFSLTTAFNPSGTGIKTLISYLPSESNLGGDTAVIFDDSTGLTRVVATVYEFNGITSQTPEDAHTTSDLASTAVITTEVTPGSGNNLIIAASGWTTDGYSAGPTDSFIRGGHSGNADVSQETAYLIQSDTSPATTSWTLSIPRNWSAGAVVFGH